MKKVDKFLDLARHMAMNSDVYKYKHGACVVKKGKLISQGRNQYKSHPLQRKYNLSEEPTAFVTNNPPHYVHAEMKALIMAKNKIGDLTDCEIYVYRLSHDGKNAISRPCAACMAAIIDEGIKKVIYTTNTGVAEETIDKKLIASRKRQ